MGQQCEKGDKCLGLHDMAEYLKTKVEDLNSGHIPECPQLREHGYCKFGYKCRFLRSHMDEQQALTRCTPTPAQQEVHTLHYTVLGSLRKRTLKFPITQAVTARLSENPNPAPVLTTRQVRSTSEDAIEPATPVSSSTHVYPSTLVASAALLNPEAQDKKQIDWKGKLVLAPLTTIGNLPFRRICKGLGADITICEMAMASKILEGSASELALLKRHPSEDVFGVQLAGRTPRQLAEAIELIESHSTTKVDFFDVNAGCPIDLVFQQGMGSALCGNLPRMKSILRTISAVSTVPVTIKIRMGVYTGTPNAHSYVDKLGEWGASAFTLHGRSRQARYSMLADWEYIDRCSRLAKIPLIGNGDVYNWEDAVAHLDNTQASALMVARGAIIKPWVFKEIKERRYWDISATERLNYVRDFCEYGLSHWGSDQRGVDTTRRFALEWLSFLYRYIPVGLLEALPSRINHRPPCHYGYFGRSELETKLASADPLDWIEITEMFLGPAPSGFSFTPKHRAEAFTRVER